MRPLSFSISAGAMSAMVSKDIVHRDLKPQNILLSHTGRTRSPSPQEIKLKIGKKKGILKEAFSSHGMTHYQCIRGYNNTGGFF